MLNMKIYQCKRCGCITKSKLTPSSKGCNDSKLHSWIYIGNSGYRQYLCQSCGTVVETSFMPFSTECLQGGLHKWVRID